MNGLTLAYLGDAYYELEVRKYLINKGFTKVKVLHNEAIKYTSGQAQAHIYETLLENDFLTEEEITIFKRGRNNSSSGRKNVDAKTYTTSTGFEAMIGYLYINDKDRLNELVNKSIDIIEKGGINNGWWSFRNGR